MRWTEVEKERKKLKGWRFNESAHSSSAVPCGQTGGLGTQAPNNPTFRVYRFGESVLLLKKIGEKKSYSMIRAMECCELEISLASQSLAFLTPARTSWHWGDLADGIMNNCCYLPWDHIRETKNQVDSPGYWNYRIVAGFCAFLLHYHDPDIPQPPGTAISAINTSWYELLISHVTLHILWLSLDLKDSGRGTAGRIVL